MISCSRNEIDQLLCQFWWNFHGFIYRNILYSVSLDNDELAYFINLSSIYIASDEFRKAFILVSRAREMKYRATEAPR